MRDALGCLFSLVGILCAGGLLWTWAVGLFSIIAANPSPVDIAILAALIVGALVVLPLGVLTLRRRS
jgi:hypothetical protein